MDSVAPDEKIRFFSSTASSDAMCFLLLSNSSLAFIPSLWIEEGFPGKREEVSIYAFAALSERGVVAALSK